MKIRKGVEKRRPTSLFGNALAKKRRQGRKPWLPQMTEVKAKTTSKVAKQFFSHPRYAGKARLLVELFNKSPQHYFEFWEQRARNLVLMTKEIGERKTIGPKEILALGDAFFAAYAPNALAEFARAEHFHFSGVMPPLSEKRYAEKRTALAGTPEYELYYKPVAELLVRNSKNQQDFDGAVEKITRGETRGHVRLRLEKDTSNMSNGERREGARLYFKKAQYAQMLRELEAAEKKGEATRIRKNELLGRQLETINEGHAALAMYLAPEIENILKRYLNQNKINGINPKAWTMLKLAQAATQLS